MTRFLTPALIAAALAAATTPALAQSPRPAVLQTVKVCGTNVASRTAYQRDHGATPSFVTAQQAVAAYQSGQRWAAPRCMTAHQYDRLAGAPMQRAAL
ncbi:hypothetical protein [Brevundimonas sp. SPF441]|uniref:hypothetical protein n=1 Tax=Brevundimonas sp. SPF441 TaxID=2663795 RepID=UPI00129D5401|nr:hypothetical protein [Brevundimonas sp. SPF441]MRL69762.1 hypothetical protein [Brevundimonas sp. SPF441]